MLVSNLWRIVYCLYIDAYTLRIIRVSGKITIKITKSLLIVASPLPESNKFTKFFMIHEREIINMPVDLSTKNDSWWSTLTTNSFWVRFVARWTFVIYFIALLHCKRLEIQLVFLLLKFKRRVLFVTSAIITGFGMALFALGTSNLLVQSNEIQNEHHENTLDPALNETTFIGDNLFANSVLPFKRDKVLIRIANYIRTYRTFQKELVWDKTIV